MDERRFDAMAKAVGRGATRRQALRLVGGGVAGALLAAVGQGRRAEAQGSGGEKPIWANCVQGPGGVQFDQLAGGQPSPYDGRPCPGSFYCPQDRICITTVNPAGNLLCRCVEL